MTTHRSFVPAGARSGIAGVFSNPWIIGLLALAAVSGALIGAFMTGADTGALLALALGLWIIVSMQLRPIQTIAGVMCFWAPLVFVMMETDVGEVAGVPINMTRFLGGVLLLALLLRLCFRVMRKEPLPRIPRPVALYGAFGAVLVVAFVRSPDPGQAAGELIRFAASFLLLIVIWYDIRRSEDVGLIHRWTLAGILASAALTVSMRFLRPDLLIFEMTGIKRAVGTFGQANVTGLLGVLGVAYLFPFLSRCRSGAKGQLWIAGNVLLVAMIVTTLSRTAIVGLLVFVTAWAMAEREKIVSGRTKVFAALALFLALGAGLALMGSDTLNARMQDLQTLHGSGQGVDEQAGSGRIGIWKHHWDTYRQGSVIEILFGRGLSSSMVVSEQMYTSVDLLYGKVQGVHNEYLWLLMEVGIFGLMVYAAALISMFRYFRDRLLDRGTAVPAEVKNLIAVVLAYAVSYQLANAVFGWSITGMGVRWYFLCYLGLGFAATRVGADYLDPAPTSQ